MKTCHCTLPYTNGPEACLNCSNCTFPTYPSTNPYDWNNPKKIKKVTKTIEKYDSEGILIGKEVITEEYEDIEIQEWDKIWPQQPWTIYGNTYTISSTAN